MRKRTKTSVVSVLLAVIMVLSLFAGVIPQQATAAPADPYLTLTPENTVVYSGETSNELNKDEYALHIDFGATQERTLETKSLIADGNGETSNSVRFGVVSDTHVAPAKTVEQERLKKIFEFFSEKADLAVVVGDLTENGIESEMAVFKDIRDNHLSIPLIASMGNHEFNRWEYFENATGCKANDVKIVNGYYFITVSPGAGEMDLDTGRATEGNTRHYAYAVDWLLSKIAEAEAADPYKPIFVFHHHPTLGTYYRTTASYDEATGLAGVLEGHSRVVTFSGHMHTPNNVSTSLWQGSYTAVNTASTSYCAVEGNTLYGTFPPYRENFAQGMLVDVQDTRVEIKNYDFYADQWINTTWTWDTTQPFPYTAEKRAVGALKPQFSEDAEIRVDGITGTQITFNFDQAYIPNDDPTDNLVRLYRYDFINKNTGNTDVSFTNVSEFYFLPMPTTLTITNTGAARALTEGEIYELRIYAYNTFDMISDDYLTLTFQAGGEVLTSYEKLLVSSDDKTVRKGDYFEVDLGFDRVVSSNAAVIYTEFDQHKFEYAGFTEADGVTVLDAQHESGAAKIIVMVGDYITKNYGKVMLRAKEDADLENETSAINVSVHYVVKDETGDKVVKTANGSTSVFTSGGDIGTGEDGKVTLIDLSNVIDLFGMDSSMPDWNAKCRKYDLNNDGKIDIQDIVTIARMLI